MLKISPFQRHIIYTIIHQQQRKKKTVSEYSFIVDCGYGAYQINHSSHYYYRKRK